MPAIPTPRPVGSPLFDMPTHTVVIQFIPLPRFTGYYVVIWLNVGSPFYHTFTWLLFVIVVSYPLVGYSIRFPTYPYIGWTFDSVIYLTVVPHLRLFTFYSLIQFGPFPTPTHNTVVGSHIPTTTHHHILFPFYRTPRLPYTVGLHIHHTHTHCGLRTFIYTTYPFDSSLVDWMVVVFPAGRLPYVPTCTVQFPTPPTQFPT